ncbi:hypothetical protein AcW1_002587 [Taiwanofungus camphoratus]|nr:hypothetical protein AcV5_009732 [Antrodia cinnamomea]KAI0942802.1 hypothetical protein AcV7_002112 [Antrodia cinnamomea]KAI0943421.1 hypothetical protein AcW1_002587 [Antrodia cinnamomea]
MPCLVSMVGTQVWVMGTVMPSTSDSTPPVSLYSIDGGNFVSYQAPSMEIEADGMTFFASEDLSQGHHTLYIEVNQASEVAPYMLDSISYTPISEPQSSFSSSLSSSTSSVASPSQPSPSSSLNGTGRHSTSPDSSNATGAIVGGVVGGLLTLAGALLVLYYCSRRRPESYKYKAMRRDSRGSFLPIAPSLRPFRITPYTLLDPEEELMREHQGQTPSASQNLCGKRAVRSSALRAMTTPAQDEPLMTETSAQTQSVLQSDIQYYRLSLYWRATDSMSELPHIQPPIQAMAPPVIMQVDSGIRFGTRDVLHSDLDVALADLPPVYTRI